ncbi:MAG: alpha/beta fold hydrolase [Chloroflexi bacterium]|nr:alpha/beta fold hydrolase [Chloroflexota bacterium]
MGREKVTHQVEVASSSHYPLTRLRADLFKSSEAILPAITVAATPSEAVDEDEALGFKLVRYRCGCQEAVRRSILFVPHIINRPYILDLNEDVSVVRSFCRRRFSVYLIDWGDPSAEQAEVGLADYAGYVNRAAALVSAGPVSILGYCTGGMISLIHAALAPDRVNGLILLATPVDFSNWLDYRILAGRASQPRNTPSLPGNVPGELFNLAGFGLLALYMPVFLSSPEFFAEFLTYEAWRDAWRRSRWLVDTPTVPSAAYVELMEGFYRDNLLMRNKLEVGKQRVDLGRIRCPLLNIIGRYDHLVPVESATALKKAYSGPEYEEIVFPASHVGLSAGRKAHRELWPKVSEWLEARVSLQEYYSRRPG